MRWDVGCAAGPRMVDARRFGRVIYKAMLRGVSVVLEPTEEADDGAISQAIEIIRQRVDGIGVAEPEITRQDDAIVVQLPGIADR